MAEFEVVLWVTPELGGLYTGSRVYLGFTRLARRGRIRLKWRTGRPRWWAGPDPWDAGTIYLEVGPPRKASVKCCIELWDDGLKYNRPALAACDVYLKRGFDPAASAQFSREQWAKVRPFGLNFACRDAATAAALVPRWARQHLLQPKMILSDLRTYFGLPRPEHYARASSDAIKPVVIYQTRVWEEQEAVAEAAGGVNEGRVALVRALRSAFGEQFRGGLVPTPYAVARYPDLVVRDQFRRSEYIAMSRQCLVGIYTRGLHYSNAFKLAEYLAAAQCIVGERLRQHLPTPLVEGANFLPFTTIEECVAGCARLLSDPRLVAEMQAANGAYYRQEVEPEAHMLRCCERATSA